MPRYTVWIEVGETHAYTVPFVDAAIISSKKFSLFHIIRYSPWFYNLNEFDDLVNGWRELSTMENWFPSPSPPPPPLHGRIEIYHSGLKNYFLMENIKILNTGYFTRRYDTRYCGPTDQHVVCLLGRESSFIYRYLKGQCHEIFCFWFFLWISFPPAPEYPIRTISNFFQKSRRYSQLKVDHRWQICHRYQQQYWNWWQNLPPVSLTPVVNL
jgi:hypothetical protein